MEEKKKKKRLVFSVIALVLVALVVLLFGTYAYWQITRKQTDRNLVGSACLKIKFSNETGDINIQNMWPTSDADGSALVPYTFTIENECDILLNYTVALEEIEEDGLTYPNNYLADSSIKIKFDNLAPVKVSTLDTITSDDEEDYEIYSTKHIVTRHLAPKASRTHRVRIWLDANAPEEEMEKFFSSKIKITGGQGIEAECYTVNSEGVLYAYDGDCGTTATIPATVNNKPVKTISSTAFKGDREVRQFFYHDASKSSDDDVVPSKEDFYYLNNNSCYDGSSYVHCTIDYTMAMYGSFGKLMNDEAEMGRVWEENEFEDEEEFFAWIGENYSMDDFFVVVNYDGDNTAKANAIMNYVRPQLSGAYEMFGWEATSEDVNSHIYTEATAPDLSDCYEQYYYVSYYNNEIQDTRELGTKETTDEYTTVFGLLIDSLDLSQATNLEKIDSIAFSNVPTWNQSNLNTIDDPSSAPVGLTSLTFGVHPHDIDLGGCAFCRSHLSELTIYSNIQLGDEVETVVDDASSAPDNFFYYLYGAFGFSNIGTINVLKAGNDTTIDTPKMAISDNINGITIYQGLGVINGAANGETTVNSVTIGTGIETIEDGAFYGLNPQSLSLPSSLITIGSSAFWAYNGTTLTIPSNVVTIGKEAFRQYQGSGQNLVIPASVRTIEEGAFYRYVGSSLTINEGVTKIGRSAFQQYNGANFTLPASVTDLGAYKDSQNEDKRGAVWASFTGTINVNRTQADFEANVTRPNYWTYGTTHFLDS